MNKTCHTLHIMSVLEMAVCSIKGTKLSGYYTLATSSHGVCMGGTGHNVHAHNTIAEHYSCPAHTNPLHVTQVLFVHVTSQ
jgi:hypothetical protein